MRAQDIDEIRATGGTDPEAITRASINRSVESYAVFAGEDLIFIFGVREVRGSHAVWMLSSESISRHRKAFWRCARAIVHNFRGKYPLMWNMVHGKNSAIGWLKKLGFTVGPPEPFGPRGDLFCCAALETKRLIEVSHV